MVVRSDTDNPPTASAADQPPGGDAHSSTFVSTQVAIEQPHRAHTGALWRLRSLKASLEKMHLLPSARDTVAMEAIRNVEKHLAALSSLRDVCASIEQRLARADTVSGRTGGPTIDPALLDVCAQIYDRLMRVEAAIQRTEGFVADKPWDLSDDRLQAPRARRRTLRLTQKSIEDSTLPEMCVNIERQIIQTRKAVQRTEAAVADTNVREFCESIDARLVRTEDSLRRTEGIVAEWLRGLSASMTTRFSDAEETIQRIERIVSSRTVEQTSPPPPSVRVASRPMARGTAYFELEPWTCRQTARDGLVIVPLRVWLLRDRSPDHVEPRRNSGARCVARGHRADVDSRRASDNGDGCNSVDSRGRHFRAAANCASPERGTVVPIAARTQVFVGSLSITSVPSGARSRSMARPRASRR